MTALNKQVGGNHYKCFKIQPTEFIHKNNLTFLQGCVIKRICRYKLKGSTVEDLEKIVHELDMLEELDKNKHFKWFVKRNYSGTIPISTFVKENNLDTFQHIVILSICAYTPSKFPNKWLDNSREVVRNKIQYLKEEK